ncbi:MAG: trehalose-phosphatase [Chloroflexi bacterium]|nr:trehalose-phosphatase [Chloroflexota bacterium]
MRESNRRTDATLSRALSLAREALAADPAGIATDIDGTLSPIVDDPGAARLADGASDALAALVPRMAVVAAVTGRAAADGRRMLGVDRVLVAGNHGTEWLEPGESVPIRVPGAGDVPARLGRMLAGLPPLAGVEAEHKGLSATIHYRAAADPAAARGALLAALAAAGSEGIWVREGRMSIELRPAGLGDKGSAVRAIVAHYRLRGLLVLGDDATDLDMFDAVAALRASGGLRAAIIAVAGGEEVKPEVASAADIVLPGPDRLVGLLRGLAEDPGWPPRR